jgi:hypothetical protein
MDEDRWVMNSLRRNKHEKICRHKVSDLYHVGSSSNHWIYVQQFGFSGLKMCTTYSVVLPFRVPVVVVTAKTLHSNQSLPYYFKI